MLAGRLSGDKVELGLVPVGSILVGSVDVIRVARRLRKRWGGAMRQVGILAAACLHALDHHIERLAEDHRRARALAEAVAVLPGVSVIAPDTNIVITTLTDARLDRDSVLRGLEERGVRLSAFGPRQIRAITHLDIDDAGLSRTIEAFAAVLAGR